ncbi:MAG: Nif3-like dinuclear metal center hexameric protein [Ignavibacteria bacterium GWF2_33_9]|nr:MAG: Nif3-like dinuclear metal center hexameric protein [Ignavibacteria bacterium GWF2_33_9]
MNLNFFLEFLENQFPSKYALPGDRIGLQVHSGKGEIENLLICHEVTPEIIGEALWNKSDTILAFHPLIYSPLQRITQEDRVGKLVSLLILHKVSLISLHTRFDVYENGTSSLFAKELDLQIEKFLIPNTENEKFGMGIIGNFAEGLLFDKFIEKVHSVTKNPLRYTKGKKDKIKKIGIVGGSGTSFLDEALANELDAMITSDATYHTFHSVKGNMALVDPGHYETEQFIVPALYKLLKEKLANEFIGLVESKISTNPISYFP